MHFLCASVLNVLTRSSCSFDVCGAESATVPVKASCEQSAS